MMGHVLFPAVDSVPASFSRRWVGDILRGELDFRGVVFADDLTMEGASAMGGVVARAEAAHGRGLRCAAGVQPPRQRHRAASMA